jgi:hypothetical protein
VKVRDYDKRIDHRRDAVQIALPIMIWILGTYMRIQVGHRLTPPELLWWAWLVFNGFTAACIGSAVTLVYIRHKYGPIGSHHADHD